MNDILNDFYFFRSEISENRETDFKMCLSFANLQPFSCRPKRLSYAEKQALDIMLNDLLERKIIREIESPYCSQTILVKKKTGEYRLCIDAE